jgi:hypothetical protein
VHIYTYAKESAYACAAHHANLLKLPTRHFAKLRGAGRLGVMLVEQGGAR